MYNARSIVSEVMVAIAAPIWLRGGISIRFRMMFVKAVDAAAIAIWFCLSIDTSSPPSGLYRNISRTSPASILRAVIEG